LKVLVTGGAGFIGSHIVDALVERGREVVVVDDLSTGFECNINTGVKLYRLSICSDQLGKIFEEEKPQIVIHMAAQTVVTRSIADPILDAEINILGSLNVISNCANFGVRKIVYSSSCAVYGTPEYLPVDEKHPVNSLSPYGVSKHTVEHYLYLYRGLYGLSYVALRYANVYGPRQNPRGEGGVVAIFTGKLLDGEQPTIFGSGDKSRDYVYVDDVVRANLLAMESEETGICNIGTGAETCDQTVFDTLSSECNYRSPAKYAAERPGEIKRMCLNNGLAAGKLGWKPRITFKDGLEKAVRYYREVQVKSLA
jgi:UDP-glucose 4-epimerase